MPTRPHPRGPYFALWIASVVAFVVAGVGGVLFRWGMLDGFALGFEPAHIRHGHSHLMLMGWVTPALMALMALHWPRMGARPLPRATQITIWSAWALAMACFVPFLLYGYKSVAIGPARMPIAAVLSGVAMLTWYAFAVVYVLATRGVPRAAALRCWDVAVAFLCVSSLGAWAVAGLIASGHRDPFWMTVTVHFFVDLFGDGWLVLGTLGLLYAHADGEDGRAFSPNLQRGLGLAALGLLGIFFLGVPAHLVPTPLRYLASLGALLLGLGLAIHLRLLWGRLRPTTHRAWLLPLTFLAAKVIALFVAAIPPAAAWAQLQGLRLPYLHVGFLGFLSLALIAAARETWGPGAFALPRAFAATVVALLLGLLPLTHLWPTALGGLWTLHAALATATAPTLVALAALFLTRRDAATANR